MIGYYIHHHGRGHLSQALAIAESLNQRVTALSSLPRHQDWRGDWVQLPLDDQPKPRGFRAGGQLHWAPLGCAGLRTRSAVISRWIDEARPAAFVVDVSVEVSLLARLHGVPVIAVALPGERDDPAHVAGLRAADLILGAWPPHATESLIRLPPELKEKIHAVGAISRFPPELASSRTKQKLRVLVLGSGGGDGISPRLVQECALDTPTWSWRLAGGAAAFIPDVWQALRSSDVVVTHAGMSSLADLSSARVPAVVVPQDRAFKEQVTTARVLHQGNWPAVTLVHPGRQDLVSSVRDISGSDGNHWSDWNDGGGAQRAAALISSIAQETFWSDQLLDTDSF